MTLTTAGSGAAHPPTDRGGRSKISARDDESLSPTPKLPQLSGATEPIVPGFFPDPTICRVGADYYMAHSSFEYFPGVPLFHSTDLIQWSTVGHILTRRSQFRKGNAGPSGGIYAGTLRHRDGLFWFVTTNVSDLSSGQLLVHAADPADPWSDPIFVRDAIGIDPDLCWDDEGTCYLTWKAMDFVTETGILQAPIDLATGQLLSTPYPVWQGSGLDAAEGPHLYHVGAYWYLLLAEGGTERGHSVTIARGPTPAGPFEAHPANPIFSRRSVVTHPVQNVGHADLVQTEGGDWASVYLGARVRGSTPGFHVLGRETFLAGVDWADGWPVFDDERFKVSPPGTGFSEAFSDKRLSDRWVVPGGEPDDVVMSQSSEGLALRGHDDGHGGLICTRVRDLGWTAEAVLSGAGSFRLRMDHRHWYGLLLEDGVVRAVSRVGEIQQEVGSVHAKSDPVILRLSSVSPSTAPVPLGQAGPDDIVLSAVADGVEHVLGRLDGRYLSTEVASGFTGRMLALGSMSAAGRFLSVRYTPSNTHMDEQDDRADIAPR